MPANGVKCAQTTKLMLDTTLDVFKAALRSDPTVPPAQRAQLLALVRRGTEAPKSVVAQLCGPRVLTPKATAEMLSRSRRYVHRLANEGVLRPVRLPNRKRGIGFLQSDVERLIAGARPENQAA